MVASYTERKIYAWRSLVPLNWIRPTVGGVNTSRTVLPRRHRRDQFASDESSRPRVKTGEFYTEVLQIKGNDISILRLGITVSRLRYN
jgi:hypothetical protein